MITRDKFKMPPQSAPVAEKLASLQSFIQEAEAFLQAQRPWGGINRAIEIISGQAEEKIPEKLSRVRANRLKRQTREVVASLSNLRPLWGYKSDNPAYEQQSAILNKLVISWWHNTFADRKIREAIQHAAVTGTGYISPRWEKDFLGIAGRGDIELDALGADQVRPIQIGADHDIQRAYGVDICKPTPINVAHSMFPEFQDLIVPDRQKPIGVAKGVQRVQRFLSPVLSKFGAGAKMQNESSIFPEVDIHSTYFKDTSVNTTGVTIPMGKPGTSWYYEVPSLGAPLPTGIRTISPDGQLDPITGLPLMVEGTRPATYEDSRMYPGLRLVQWTNTCIIYDGPSYWWHSRFPLVQFRLDDWPWDFLGTSIVLEGAALQASNTSLLRAIDDSANARLRPPMKYDQDAVAQSTMTRFDPRQPGQTLGMTLSMGPGIEPVLPAEFYDVPDWIREHIHDNEERMDYLLGVQDMTALMKARQTPAADTVEKVQEMAGPLITDMSRNMERSLRDLGDMIKALFFQFYHTTRRIQILGVDGVTEEDFYYEPGDMIPSHLPGEDRDAGPSRAPLLQRAKWHQGNFMFHITPGSMHEITQMSRKMFYLQLARNQFPIDPWTQGEAYGIPNMGSPPNDAKNVIERFFAYQELVLMQQLKMQIKQAEVQAMMMADPNLALIAGAASNLGGAGQAGREGEHGGNAGPGRKPTSQVPPHAEQKDDGSGGQRTTISESK